MDSVDFSLTRRAAWRYVAVVLVAISGVVNAADQLNRDGDRGPNGSGRTIKWSNAADNSIVVTPSGKKERNLTSSPSAERK